MSLAWHIAALQRTSPKKKLPTLKSLMIRDRPPAPQSEQQQFALVKQWVVAMGGTIKTVKVKS